MREFRRKGMQLSAEERARLVALRQREGELCAQFEQTINENTDAVYFTAPELQGVSPSFLASLPVDAETGKHKVGLKFPEACPVLQFADSAATRLTVETARLARCPSNVAVLAELVSVRCEAARALGFRSHAEFVLETRMAKSVPTVTEFIDKLVTKLTPKVVFLMKKQKKQK